MAGMGDDGAAVGIGVGELVGVAVVGASVTHWKHCTESVWHSVWWKSTKVLCNSHRPLV